MVSCGSVLPAPGLVGSHSGVIPAERTVETLSIVAETKVSEANCRLFSQARFFFEIRVS